MWKFADAEPISVSTASCPSSGTVTPEVENDVVPLIGVMYPYDTPDAPSMPT